MNVSLNWTEAGNSRVFLFKGELDQALRYLERGIESTFGSKEQLMADTSESGFIKRRTYSQVNTHITYSQVKSQVNTNRTYSQVNTHRTYSQVNSNRTYSQVNTNRTYSQVNTEHTPR